MLAKVTANKTLHESTLDKL